jgi:hypothetical protein
MSILSASTIMAATLPAPAASGSTRAARMGGSGSGGSGHSRRAPARRNVAMAAADAGATAAAPEVMKAWRLTGYGMGGDPADAIANELKLDAAVPVPLPGAGQIQVKVEYASVNPIDWKIFSGAIHGVAPCVMPYTPGFDVAGTVSAVGEGRRSDFRLTTWVTSIATELVRIALCSGSRQLSSRCLTVLRHPSGNENGGCTSIPYGLSSRTPHRGQ